MNKRCLQITCMVFMISFTSIQAQSQTLYSLFDLARLANKHSQTIKIAQDDLYIAQLEKKRALSVLVPKATVYGNVLERKNEDLASPDTMALGGKLTQSFTLNGKELIALNITKDFIESKSFSLESIRAQYMLAVAQAYYNILSAQRYLEIAQSDVERLSTYRDSVKEKLIVGNVAKTDLFRAEAELSKSLTERVLSENKIFKTKAQLQNLVDMDDSYDLEKEPLSHLENYQCSLDQIKEIALKNRVEIKEAAKNLEIARKTTKYNKSDYWPTLSLEAGYRETDIEYKSGVTDVAYDTEDLYVSGELSFTFFDGGLRSATIRQKIADERKAQNTLELKKKAIILESENSYYDYESAKNTIINLEDELKSAQETLNAVNMQLEYGMADSIDAIDANSLLVSAQRRISDAQYTYYLAVLKIMYTKGELIEFLSQQGS
ncbi:MAG: TolC family protein [Pseudomonadota bacterium]